MRDLLPSFRSGLRFWFLAVASSLLLAGCGGGGGDGDAAPLPSLEGTWRMTVTIEDETSSPLDVPAAQVPTEQMLSGLTTQLLAQDLVVFFEGYTVTLDDSRIMVTGPGTNYLLVIHSFVVSDYQDCGVCGVGSTVEYTLSVNYSESGTVDGEDVPAVTTTIPVRFRYERVL